MPESIKVFIVEADNTAVKEAKITNLGAVVIAVTLNINQYRIQCLRDKSLPGNWFQRSSQCMGCS